jgi:hypothetical protein
MPGDIDNRKTDRVDIFGELLGEVMVYEPMAIKQVSLAGVSIETTFPLQIDSLHDFRLMLGDRSLVVKGRIVHTHVCDVEHGEVIYRSGIEFVEPSERVTEAIADFMHAIRAGRGE